MGQALRVAVANEAAIGVESGTSVVYVEEHTESGNMLLLKGALPYPKHEGFSVNMVF